MTARSTLRTDANCFKLVLLGESAVGKSSIVMRYAERRYDPFIQTTLSGAAFISKEVEKEGEQLTLNIWDTAGQERFKGIAPLYYRGADAALVVYDISKADSFEKAKDWVRLLQLDASPQVVIALVGNKLDRAQDPGGRQISTSEGQQYAEEESLLFMEVSAKTGENIEESFMSIVEKLPSKSNAERNNENDLLDNNNNNNGGSWFGSWCSIL
eukprot:m.18842 g.18842  ORF g.18842 m.18842 type:complete len:213 (+) comp8367_c0_seq3:245-883(+)